MRPHITLAWALIAMTLPLTSAIAERPPERKQAADLILVGTVGKIYTNTDKFNVNSVVEVEIQVLEQGTAAKVGETVDARCFQRLPSAPRVPAAYGHRAVPKEGDRVRVYLMRRDNGLYEGTYPDWFESLPLK